jgi:hypothetical protein
MVPSAYGWHKKEARTSLNIKFSFTLDLLAPACLSAGEVTGQKGLSHMTSEGWGEQPAPIGHNSGEAEGWPVTQTEAEAAAPVQKFEVIYPGQPDTEDPEHFRLRRNAEIEHWLNAKPILESAKQNEMDLRTKVTATLFPAPKKGTQRYDIGGGYKVKLVHGLTYTLGDKDKLNDEGAKVPIRKQIEDLEAAIIEKHGEAGLQLVKRLISWTPTLSGSEYEKLDADSAIELDVRTMISEVLTVKPASPQLTFEEPKES